ncbi:Hsp20/alpha crystallin family protein [Gammaproteobacteria bacterium]|nr:Hsp20/alpha crystallin family protein [Gammaproteobacteria bacterium]
MSIVRWNPFPEFDASFSRGMRQNASAVRRADWAPLVDIREDDQSFLLEVEVPAVASEDLSVSMTEGLLTVSGSSQASEDLAERSLRRSERRRGAFSRTFKLPEGVETDAISAEMKEGVLYLSIPKKQAIKQEIEIKVAT